MNGKFAAPRLALSCSLIAASALFFLTGYPDYLPPWVLTRSSILVGFLFAGALSVAIVFTNTQLIRNKFLLGSLGSTLVLGSIICLPVLVLLLLLTNGITVLPELEGDNAIFLTLFTAFFVLLVVNSLPLKRVPMLAINTAVLVIAMVPSMIDIFKNYKIGYVDEVRTSTANSTSYVFGSLHDIKVTDYKIFSKRKFQKGGGLSVFDDRRVLLVAGDGDIVLLDIEQEDVRVTPTTLRAPFDARNYRKFAFRPSSFFRVTDSLVETAAGRPEKLYVAYHHWDDENSCVTMKVADAAIDFESFGQSDLEWSERFTSSPCLVGQMSNRTGGRLSLLGEHTLLLTVGTTLHDWDAKDLAESSYGKIIALDKRSWDSRIFSSGHRNSQGLLVLQDESIWATEHGPQGGDELNLIREGVDYGWPIATYGTDYGQKTFSRNNTPGDHTFGERPIYSWVPSIGVSNLIAIQGAAFPSWRGDFMVSSLEGKIFGKSLFRVKIAEGRVVVSERMRTGLKVRDLLELEDGRLVLWDGRDTVQVVEPADIVFSECIGCHSLDKSGIGPPLMDVVDARVARIKNYQYSDAMKSFGGTWTRRRLDDFLKDPSKALPGTTMTTPGIADPDRRKAIIDYLQELRPPQYYMN